MELVSNGFIQVGLCPDRGGRIYSLSVLGGVDRFYHPPDPNTPSGWKNWGGDFLWVSPQSAWGWPPPNEWEVTPWTMLPDDDGVRMISGLYRGTRLQRHINFDNTYSIKVTNTLQSVSEASDWGLWNITQLPVDGVAVSAARDGEFHFFDFLPKVGWYGPRGLITVEYSDGIKLIKQFYPQPCDADYPHGGNVEFYCTKQYQEAEICWSRVHLGLGESVSVVQRFILELP